MYAWEITNTADLEICTDALRAELAEWDAKLEASGVEDATAWEHFPEMEEVMYALAEFEHELAKRKDFESRYPREQYELDRAKAIAEGTDPRCIMSYQECFAHDCWEREMEREQEIWDAYDEAYEQMAIAAEVAERDSIIEQAELAWETSMAELGAFGNVWPEEGVSQVEYDEGLEEFWEFACDLYEEGETWNERLVLTELF